MPDNFVHLHVHTCYSELDGLGKVEDYVQKAKELGMKALAITDHGSTTGHYHFYKECIKNGIKPILGTEFYYRTEMGTGHLVVLAMNNEGLENIYKLQHYAYVKGFYKKPCVDISALKKYNKGLIVTSACLANPIPRALLAGNYSVAYDYAVELQEVFGSRFYIELQSSQNTQQAYANQQLVSLARKIGAEIVLTNDCHYINPEDAKAHEILLAIQTKVKMNNPKRFKFDFDDYYFKDVEQIKKDVYVPLETILEALDTTNRIADMCNVEIIKEDHMPKYYATPNGMTEAQYLSKLSDIGYQKRIVGTEYETDKYHDELMYELSVIEDEKYSGYHLIVQDYINYARKNKIIVGDGRGSGCGAKTGYVIGIHTINPDKYQLLFERFMAHGREPDIDVDFSDRMKVIQYLRDKYGKNNVAMVGASSILTTPVCFKNVASVFEHTTKEVLTISKQLDGNWCIDEALEKCADFRKYCISYPNELEIMRKLHGIVRHSSTHAGGVIIADNIINKVPVRAIEIDGKRDMLIACYDKDVLHDLGYTKFDLLGLNTLTVIEEAIISVNKEYDAQIDLDKLSFDDPEIYSMLCEGDVDGVFQVSNQKQMTVQMQPKCFDDLIALNALIRPGASGFDEYCMRKNGKTYTILPERKEYMDSTYGLMLYQEQYLLDCKVFAGWTIAFADAKVRKNKDIRNDKTLKALFLSDSVTRGFKLEDMEIVWSEIEDSVDNGYGFNKSHATSYAVTLYKSAWLKCYHPDHFYASVMNHQCDNTKELSEVMFRVKQKKITISPPDINLSTDKFIARGGNIYYKLSAIKDVGDSAYTRILASRPYNSVQDLINKTEKRYVRTNVVSALIKAGCFDFENSNRVILLNQLDVKEKIHDEWNDKLKMAYEKDSIGFYLTNHPLDEYFFAPLTSFNNNSNALIAGEIISVTSKNDKNENLMGFIEIMTQYGMVKGLVFSSKWSKKVEQSLTIGDYFIFEGTKSNDAILINKIKKL